MSEKALKDLIDRSLSKVNLKDLGFPMVGKVGTSTISGADRAGFNKVVHALYINDKLLATLAPESLNILTQGTDKTAIQIILGRYRSFRNKPGKVRQAVIDKTTGEKAYRLLFDNFDTVRRFLSSLGLDGRPTFILNWFKQNTDGDLTLLTNLLKEVGYTPDLTSGASIMSSLAHLNPENKKAALYGNDVAAKLYRKIYDTIDGFDVGHNTPIAYETVELIAGNRDILDTVVKDFYKVAGIKSGYSRSLGDIAKYVKTTVEKEIEKILDDHSFVAIKDIRKKSSTISVVIESSKANQEGASEDRILKAFRRSIIDGIRRNLATRDKVSDSKILNQAGSISIKDFYENQLLAAFGEFTKVKAVKGSYSKSKKQKLKSVVNLKSPKVTSSSVSGPKLPQLRTPQGRFTSLTNLEVLIRQQLQQTVIKNMQRPNLRNRTGRFAGSVELKSLSRARDGAITAFLTYMRYPYATFEREGAQGHKGYYPSRLIDVSAREIAAKLVKERFRTVVQ
jgi:hypothetical protein